MHAEIFNRIGSTPALDTQWNELLNKSVYAVAACRAEVLAMFQANFAIDRQLAAVVVRSSSGSLVAGLPLMIGSRSRIFTTASSVANEWCQCGQLLLDKDSDHESALVALLDGLSQMRMSTLWLDWIPFERPEWQQLRMLAQQRGWRTQSKQKFEVGVTRLPETWTEFECSLSKNSRKRVRSELKQLNKIGCVQLDVVSARRPGELATAMQVALEIERQSWKGSSGTEIARHPNVRAFFLNAAQCLNPLDSWRLFLLRLNGNAIAFDLGERFGTSYRSWKISYLPEYADYSPGHVLNQLVIRHLIDDSSVEVCDSVGALTQANRRWSNDHYLLGRMVLAPQSWLRNPTGHTLVSSLKVRDSVRRNSLKKQASSRPIV